MNSNPDYLHEIISKSIQKIIKPENFLFRLIQNRFEKQSLRLTEEQEKIIKQKLLSKDINNFSIELTETQINILESNNCDANELLNFSNLPFENFRIGLEKSLASAQDEVITLVGNSLYESWIHQIPEVLKEIDELDSEFLKNLHSLWGKELSLLRALVDISRYLGDDFNNKIRPQAAKENDLILMC